VDSVDSNASDVAHAHLLSSRVQLHDGVWLISDNIRKHDTFMVKLWVCMLYLYLYIINTSHFVALS